MAARLARLIPNTIGNACIATTPHCVKLGTMMESHVQVWALGPHETGELMSFILYLVGFVIMIFGLAWGAELMHIPPRWIGVGVVVLLGGILSGVGRTRRRDPQ